MTIFDSFHRKSFVGIVTLTSLNWYLFKQSNQDNKYAMKTYSTGRSVSIPRFRIRVLATQMKILTRGLLQHIDEIGTFCMVCDI